MARTCLYHSTCPDGQLFEEEEAPELLRNGWVDAPWEIDNPDYVTNDPRWAEKVEEVQATTDNLKPWQKAQLAKKAKKDKLSHGGT